MEHRCDPGKAINIEIVIQCRWGAVGGRALYLSRSRGGACVELRPSALDVGGKVEVMLVSPSQETGALRLSTLVVHATTSGVGLMFLYGDRQIARLWVTGSDMTPYIPCQVVRGAD